jgi:hypothetical protein
MVLGATTHDGSHRIHAGARNHRLISVARCCHCFARQFPGSIRPAWMLSLDRKDKVGRGLNNRAAVLN